RADAAGDFLAKIVVLRRSALRLLGGEPLIGSRFMTEEDLFLRALDKPAAEWPAFLAGVCGRDDALRRRVEVLLAAHDNPGSFLAGPGAGPATATADPDGPAGAPATAQHAAPAEDGATRLGPYKLL